MTDPHLAPTPLADDEPETPTWLPALGFVLFVAGGLAWAVTPPTAEPATPPAAASAKAPEAASAAAAVQRPPPPPTPPPANTAPSTAPIPPPARPLTGAGAPRRDMVGRPAKKHPAVP